MTAAALLAALALAAARPDACFWTRGRLSIWNGTPAVRIWPVGSRRMLGVHTRDGAAEGPGLMPPAVQARLDAGGAERTAVVGEFRLCPLAADRPGRMRPVWIAAVRRLRTAVR